jgi:hypothetical protein
MLITHTSQLSFPFFHFSPKQIVKVFSNLNQTIKKRLARLTRCFASHNCADQSIVESSESPVDDLSQTCDKAIESDQNLQNFAMKRDRTKLAT